MRKFHCFGTGDFLIAVSLHDYREISRAGSKRSSKLNTSFFCGTNTLCLSLTNIVAFIFSNEGQEL